jgi:DNA-binding IclR family transcriptional regulator
MRDKSEVNNVIELFPPNCTDRSSSVVLPLRVFEALSDAPAGLSFHEFRAQIDIDESVLAEVLSELVAELFVSFKGGRFGLGPSSFRLWGHILAARPSQESSTG